MLGRARRVKVEPTEVTIRPPVTHRDPVPSPVVSSGPGRVCRQRRIRRSKPIRAYIGPNGHGKSLAAVYDLMPSLQLGRTVLSTVPLLDWTAKPDPAVYVLDPQLRVWVHAESGAEWQRPVHPHYVRLTEWSQLMESDHCDVLLDDVAGVASSRQSSGMPAAIEKLLQKLRHDDITLSWTAPAWARADLVIRETTQAVTIARGSRTERRGDSSRLWLRHRQFEWTTYDSATYTDWTEGKREKAIRLCSQRFWGPGSDAFNAYDSLGGVDTITSVTDAGRCVSCGGTRRAPACVCPDYVERVAESEAARAARKRSADGARRTLPITDHRGRHAHADAGRARA